MFKQYKNKTCDLPGDCANDHIFNPATCKCVYKNSPIGKIISRGIDMKIPSEGTYPAYADQMFYDLMAGLTKQVSDLLLDKQQIEGGESELAIRARQMEMRLSEQQNQLQLMMENYEKTKNELSNVQGLLAEYEAKANIANSAVQTAQRLATEAARKQNELLSRLEKIENTPIIEDNKFERSSMISNDFEANEMLTKMKDDTEDLSENNISLKEAKIQLETQNFLENQSILKQDLVDITKQQEKALNLKKTLEQYQADENALQREINRIRGKNVISDADALRLQDLKDRQIGLEQDANIVKQQQDEAIKVYNEMKSKIEGESQRLNTDLHKLSNERIDVDVLRFKRAQNLANKLLSNQERLSITDRAKMYLLNAGIRPFTDNYNKVMNHVRKKVDENEDIQVDEKLLKDLDVDVTKNVEIEHNKIFLN